MYYYVVACYQSKYGHIAYVTKVKEGSNGSEINLDNVFLYTFYLKGGFTLEVGSVYKLSYITSQDGKLYAFPEA